MEGTHIDLGISAAVAGGMYPTSAAAAERLSPADACVYRPTPEGQSAYARLYARYKTLHDYFGKENPALMRALRGGE